VDYIDYDTRDKIFNSDIPRAYQVSTITILCSLRVDLNGNIGYDGVDELQTNCWGF